MKPPQIAIAVCAAVAAAAPDAAGEDFTVGFDTVICEGGSDTTVNVPFRRPTSYSGAVSGTPAVNAGDATVTAAGSPGFPAGAFTTEAHYLVFTLDGTRSDRVYEVTAHDATTITIALGNDDLAGVADGDSFEVVPYWTLATLLPKESQGTIHVSPDKPAELRKSEVLLSGETYFLTADGWFRSEPGFPAADEVIIPPGRIFTIRHPAGELETAFVTQQVLPEDSRITARPDATVGKTPTAQKGDGKYNRTGSGQKLKQVSKNRKKLKFIFRVQNDSAFRSTIQLTATPKDQYFKVKYFKTSGGRTNLTAALKRDDYQKEFVGGMEESFQLDVKPTRRAKRVKKTLAIDAKSAGNLMDRVKAEVKAK